MMFPGLLSMLGIQNEDQLFQIVAMALNNFTDEDYIEFENIFVRLGEISQHAQERIAQVKNGRIAKTSGGFASANHGIEAALRAASNGDYDYAKAVE